MKDRLTELQEKCRQAEKGGGPERVKEQHAKGKLTARERVAYQRRRDGCRRVTLPRD